MQSTVDVLDNVKDDFLMMLMMTITLMTMLTTTLTEMTKKMKIDNAPDINPTPQPGMQFTGDIMDNDEDNFSMPLPC